MLIRCCFLSLVLLLVFGCTDVLEQDLDGDQVVLLAPADNLVTTEVSQVFWWEASDDVTGYRIRVVSPSFDSIARLVIDDQIEEGLTYETTLPAGDYQWTVVGTNSFSETTPVIRNLTVLDDSTQNLTAQTVLLVGPEEGQAQRDSTVSFLWQELEVASNYRVQIANPDFSNNSFIVEDVTVEGDNYTTTLPEGEYQWRVRGENDTSVTPYSTRSFFIDSSNPTAPILNTPNDRDTVSSPVFLAWSIDESSSQDTLYLYSDALLNDLVLKIGLSETSYTFSNGVLEKYYWRLRSVDSAGNLSPFSSLRSFYLN